MNVFLAVVIVAWSGVLTVVVLALVRQVTTVQLALEQRGSGNVDLDADGPRIGATLPESTVELLGDPSADVRPTLVLVASPTCGPCRELLGGLDNERIPAAVRTIALIAGDGPPAAEVRELAGPKFEQVVIGAPARNAAEDLSVHSSPFLLSVVGGVVTGKTYVRTVDDIYSAADDVVGDRALVETSGRDGTW